MWYVINYYYSLSIITCEVRFIVQAGKKPRTHEYFFKLVPAAYALMVMTISNSKYIPYVQSW